MKYFAKLTRACLALVLLCSINPAFADAPLRRVVYVNGVMTTMKGAEDTRRRIDTILNVNPLNHTGDQKRNFIVANVWNPAGWSNLDTCTLDTGFWQSIDASSCLYKDNVELAMLKTAEEWYMSSIQWLQSPHDAPRPFHLGNAQTVANYADPMFNQMQSNNGLVKNGIADSWSMRGLQQAISDLEDELRWKGSKVDGSSVSSAPVVVVAHSQGNLLANLAYAKVGVDMNQDPSNIDDPANHVRIVNLANTSRISMHNLSMLNAHDGAVLGETRLPRLANLYDTAYNEALRYRCVNAGGNDWSCTATNDAWRRTTPAFAGSTGFPAQSSCDGFACRFVVGDPTFEAPDDSNTVHDQSVFAGCYDDNGAGLDAGMSDDNHLTTTYLGCINSSGQEVNRLVSVRDSLGVLYTRTHQRFRDFFEDLVYTASISLDRVNPYYTQYQGSYTPLQPIQPIQPIIQTFIDTDLTNLNNIQVWGGGHYDNSTSGLYGLLLPGDAGINIGLPPNVKQVDLTAHMMFLATSDAPFQNGFGFFGNNGPYDALYMDFPWNADTCGAGGKTILAKGGINQGWSCNDTTSVSTDSLVNKGWINVRMSYFVQSCEFVMNATRESDNVNFYYHGNLNATQCTNRSGLMINTGGPNGDAYLLLNHLKVVTTQ